MSNHRRNKHSLRIIFFSFALSALIILPTVPGSAWNLIAPTALAASPIVVNSSGDESDVNIGDGICDVGTGFCTLRAALQEANLTSASDTINFNLGLNSFINLHTALPSITNPITINGTGAEVLTIRRSNDVNTPSFRIFMIDAFPGEVNISGLTVANGLAPQGSDGGGIFIQNSTTVTISNAKLTGNATADAVSIRAGFGGAIFNRGTLTVSNTTVNSNTTGKGASSGPGSGGDGGGIYNQGILNVVKSTISGNATGDGGSGGNPNQHDGYGGGIYNANTANLTNSTISNNATGLGSNTGPGGQGAGIFNGISGATLRLSNCTVANNVASDGLANSVGGGITGRVTLNNTIIANNAASLGPDFAGDFISEDYNLIRNTSATSFSGQTTHDLTGQDPSLGPLANNGGSTLTRALLANSPAIDAGNSALTIDQRGLPRPFDQSGIINAAGGNGSDIGAYEANSGTSTFSFDSPEYDVSESGGSTILFVTRSGDTTQPATVDYATADINAQSRSDYITALGTLRFDAGQASKTLLVVVNVDSFVEGTETLSVALSNPTGGAVLGMWPSTVLRLNDVPWGSPPNPIDQPSAFVRQHYHDFLNRDTLSDQAGWAFWTNQITECQQPGATCSAAVRRINVSAAFFLSIEFQETGYLVERLYKTAYGDATGTSNFGSTHTIAVPIVRLNEFLPDSQEIGRGLVVGFPGWEQVLENNKVAFTNAFVQRSRFQTSYSALLTPAQFVDLLFAHTGVTPTAAERTAAINEFGGAGDTANYAARARALRLVAQNQTLNQNEKNRAFVLMQYFGYLRRNPNDPQDTDYSGYDFWLTKLNDFNGNFVNADMVQAFIESGEYRGRFGP